MTAFIEHSPALRTNAKPFMARICAWMYECSGLFLVGNGIEQDVASNTAGEQVRFRLKGESCHDLLKLINRVYRLQRQGTIRNGILIRELAVAREKHALLPIRLQYQLMCPFMNIPHCIVPQDTQVLAQLQKHVIDGEAYGFWCLHADSCEAQIKSAKQIPQQTITTSAFAPSAHCYGKASPSSCASLKSMAGEPL